MSLQLQGNELGWIIRLAEMHYDSKEFRKWVKKNKMEGLDEKLQVLMCKVHPNNFNPGRIDDVWLLIKESEKATCDYEVKPMPYPFCESCMFNGCYPWNTNPALLCGLLGGLFPTLLVVGEEEVAIGCSNYKHVEDQLWLDYLEDLKKEAKHNEKIRIKAIDGKVFSNHPLPAETLLYRLEKRR